MLGNTGIVDENVETSISLHDVIDHGFARFFARNVKFDSFGFAAFIFDDIDRFLYAGHVDIRNDELSALFGECAGHDTTHTFGRTTACNDDYLICEI